MIILFISVIWFVTTNPLILTMQWHSSLEVGLVVGHAVWGAVVNSCNVGVCVRFRVSRVSLTHGHSHWLTVVIVVLHAWMLMVVAVVVVLHIWMLVPLLQTTLERFCLCVMYRTLFLAFFWVGIGICSLFLHVIVLSSECDFYWHLRRISTTYMIPTLLLCK